LISKRCRCESNPLGVVLQATAGPSSFSIKKM
jgi:hypothetical protein